MRVDFVAAVRRRAKATGFRPVLAAFSSVVRSLLELGPVCLLVFGFGRFRVCFERVIAAAAVGPALSAVVVDLATRIAVADFGYFAFRSFAALMAARAKARVAAVARAFSLAPRSFSLRIRNSPSPLCSVVRP